MCGLEAKDVFTVTDGIFKYLQELDVPWQELNISDVLDSEYLYNIAFSRFTSPLVRNLAGDDEELTTEDKEHLADIIFSMFSLRWSKLWETMQYEYNPIENYSMTEQMTNDETSIVYGRVDTLAQVKNTTDTDTNEVQGFDSSQYKPSDRYTSAHTGTDTDTNTQSGEDTHTRNYTLTRSGNIGVTTSQQMIESERILWNWLYFYDVVFPDINRVLTLSVY